METYINDYHKGHLCIRLEKDEIASLNSSAIEELIREYGKPIQISVSSEESLLIEKLVALGFCPET